MVDPSTGYRVQRIGSLGETDGFQIAGDSDLHVPYDVPMPARVTSQIVVSGNLSADETFESPQTQLLASNVTYTQGGTAAVGTTLINDLDQYTGTLTAGVITFSGYKPDGTALGGSPTTDLTMDVTATTTLQDVLDYLNVDEGGARTAEIQTVTLTGGGGVPDEGKYTLTYDGATTTELDYDANVATITTALNALSTVPNDGDIVPSAALATGTTFTFANSMGDSDGEVPLITITSVGLKDGGVDVTGVCAETVKGHGPHGVLDDATASLVNGQIRITDATSGYSKSDLTMTWSGDGTLTMPAYFEMLTVGGDEVRSVNIKTYDSQGGKHVFSGAFVRTDDPASPNTWDMVLTSITGNINDISIANRRIEGITFDATNGYYTGLSGSDPAEFVISFAHDPSNPQTISLDFGTVGSLNGLTQFAGNSTAVAKEQDGYEAGNLSTVSVNKEGIVIGAFSNGIKKDIAAVQIALFQNTSGLESVGGGYFTASANSGAPVATQALTGGAGSIHGGALEKSNADVATQFVSMIQAQNGFQANARTIRVANDILRELSNLIR